MSELPPCGMCGAPWAQTCRDLENKLTALQQAVDAVLETEFDDVLDEGHDNAINRLREVRNG